MPEPERAQTCAGCRAALNEGPLGLRTCATAECPGNLAERLDIPTVCIGCGEPNPSPMHALTCAPARQKMAEPVRFTPVKRRRVKVYIDTADWWIGYYRGPNHHYVCPLPTIVIRWRRRTSSPGEPS